MISVILLGPKGESLYWATTADPIFAIQADAAKMNFRLAAHRIGNQVVIEVERRARRSASADFRCGLAHQSRRDADRGAPRGHFADHHGIGADARRVADADIAEDLCPGADEDAAAQRRMALALVPGGAAQRLQACDYFLWALQRFYERGEERFLGAMWQQFVEVIDLDLPAPKQRGKPRANTVIFNEEHPLTLESRAGVGMRDREG